METLDTVQMIAKLQESLRRHGNLPVIIYKDFRTRWEVSSVAPCTNLDHLLISTGDPDRG